MARKEKEKENGKLNCSESEEVQTNFAEIQENKSEKILQNTILASFVALGHL